MASDIGGTLVSDAQIYDPLIYVGPNDTGGPRAVPCRVAGLEDDLVYFADLPRVGDEVQLPDQPPRRVVRVVFEVADRRAKLVGGPVLHLAE